MTLLTLAATAWIFLCTAVALCATGFRARPSQDSAACPSRAAVPAPPRKSDRR